ncbi:MAG: bifunctional folylpolyglutamate synthase/dihydrofolate synthase [Verrucomicrobia bacterium]|nr:bifunctional folylpolyglutamate synthase/dihydrofolate synthase [Verrucomicrobiota bacterium]
MTYAEAIEFLYGLRLFGLKLGLENTLRLAELAGNPQRRLRFIHVAGTNGKGSTCAMLEGIYRAAGWRTGLFTSPHLVSFSERIQVDRQPIPRDDVVRLVERARTRLGELPADHHPTFFEVVVIMALEYFAEQQCGLVIWETGMGGRLDATNIVTPLASVITNIQFDHQKWLGNTRAQIAAEKGGIIKPQIPVLTATDEPDALEVLTDIARAQEAPLTVVNRQHPAFADLAGLPLALPGEHQRLNAALAAATVRQLQPLLPVIAAHVRDGLAHVHWPGRLQLVTLANGHRLLLDGAHNLAGVASLEQALARYFPGTPLNLVLGILEDKDWPHMGGVLAPLARRVFCVPVRSERTASPAGLADSCRAANPGAEVRVCASVPEAMAESTRDPFTLVAGSLYLVGEAMEWLGLSPTAGASESEAHLNESFTRNA